MQWIYNSPLFPLSLTFSSNLDKKKSLMSLRSRDRTSFWSIYIHHESVCNYKFRAAPSAGQFVIVFYGQTIKKIKWFIVKGFEGLKDL